MQFDSRSCSLRSERLMLLCPVAAAVAAAEPPPRLPVPAAVGTGAVADAATLPQQQQSHPRGL